MKYILGFFTIIALAVLGWLLYLYSTIRFEIDKVVDYKPRLTTQFFDKNGKLIANTFSKENRLYVKYENIPPRVIEALVAIEDTQFFEHNGINPDAISRAIIKDIKAGSLVEGASTLTQQLIKTLILSREKKLTRKIKEALLALRLETILSKEEILERYLNQVYFGHGYYGIKTAALGYFKKNLYELNLKEIAMLVGLPRAPSFYDPTRNLNFALARGNQVIKRMNTLGWINKKEYEESMKYVPKVYDQTLTQNKAPYVIDYVTKILSEDIKDLKTGGYKIDLTVDLDAQKIAKEGLDLAYKKILKRDDYFQKLNKKRGIEKEYDENGKELDPDRFIKTLNGALISIESNSGKILSLVGGIDYTKSNFNRVIQSKRQPGSAFKPFIYLTALDLGYSPASQLTDISRTYEYEAKDSDEKKKWQPKNYSGKYKGLMPLREALVHSRNLATINLVTDIGIDVVYNNLQRFGFSDNMPYNLSITLGSFAISPIDLSEEYSIISNDGIKVKPYIINSITNRNGSIINFEPQSKVITDENQAFLMKDILHDAVKRGTGRIAQVKNIDIAGKTGTTNKNVDAWFCGFSPTIQTIVWFGNDDNKPMRKTETGGRAAGPAFAYFYKNYLKIHPELKREFDVPSGVKSAIINGKKEYYTNTSKLPIDALNVPKENQIEF
ncbi:penicillin-binding protein [Malaciobacter molluscorum LMG 25693]|uniref:Penicillin-binding protein n=1 Tax=Malaciobacter molluscorum LMG 25693 TaxID=870501 RepID=A0A2G1DFF1_9BACT|nr:PBP1A family penicillin-binding protein [Malaciobacter molluscorum]AXX93271.1 penicillin-binding protein 1A [Malaciobacter molluscorum LMG 25693]PHO17056.1 penicillin-binding protein [Malaciobacter molluscorum LMG 25693]